MSNRDYPPAYLRYLKARLRNLGRPSFWVTAIFLSVLGLGMWEYLSNPDMFTQKQNQEVAAPKVAESSLSTEDRAAVADIDNLPVLIKDFEQANLAATLSIPEENSKAKNSQSLFDDVINQQPAATNIAKSNPSLGIINGIPTPKQNNPFVVQADNLLRSGYSNSPLLGAKSLTTSPEEIGSATKSFNQEMGLANQNNKSQNSVVNSSLQGAINQSQNQNLSSLNSLTASPTNIMGTNSYSGVTSTSQNLFGFNSQTSSLTSSTGATSTPPSNGLPSQTLPANTSLNTGAGYAQPATTNFTQNPYTNFNNSQLLPNGVQATSVTPSVTSAATTNISPYSTPTQIQGVVNPSTPTVYGNYGVQQPTQLPQSRNSLPRPTPGPYGGVQINGYTYP
ncbi:hypothetical protein BV372_24765 [Nostoc sp. T09]|uniref:hypothetical protein n=1 Tax=Nostoc sp. T09 TaxID=1932621 RepID=UPI000A380EC5|nr:hypothetical protein [Nostoc sp. T09]OUL28611.1 hypothetical protein BV372_24765 [Nostoc sp. T09]